MMVLLSKPCNFATVCHSAIRQIYCKIGPCRSEAPQATIGEKIDIQAVLIYNSVFTVPLIVENATIIENEFITFCFTNRMAQPGFMNGITTGGSY
jgi:hypothetical protein